MNRFVAIILGVFVLSFAVLHPLTSEVDSWRGAALHAGSLFGLAFGLLFYCGFALLHAVGRIEDPRERIGWAIMIVGVNVAGAATYYVTKYQKFRAEGLGRIPFRPADLEAQD